MTALNINSLKRKVAKVTHYRPSSFPYLSGDTFRSFASHIHDELRSISATQVQNGDVLFVATPQLDDFFTKIAPAIENRFVLITHNGDRNIKPSDVTSLPANLIHWFAQNCLVRHPKLSPLPIGLENKHIFLHGIPSYFNTLRSEVVHKETKILYKFNVNTNLVERGAALLSLEKHPLAETYDDWRQSFGYLRTLQRYKFIASPAGNGEDCIRTWESFYLGAVPILKRTIFTEYLETLGLPIVLINDWSELHSYTNDILSATYAKIAPKFNNPALWAPYWKQLILQKSHEHQS